MWFFNLLVVLTALGSSRALLFPAVSTIGVISSVSVPVVEYFPERRILVDWCFQMNYDLPYELSSFYNIPIWPGIQNPKSRRSIDDPKHLRWYDKYNRKLDNNRHPSDFSAGDLYQGIEDFLVSYGYNETCLLRSVCDLARHPFDDAHQNILTDIITFLLTPSSHNGFDASEKMYREIYETAEQRGFLGADCKELYPYCQKDFLTAVTKTIFKNEWQANLKDL